MNLHQEKFQSIQDFRDQYLAMKKVCDVLDLRIGRCETDVKDVLKKKNVTNPTDAQLNKAMDKIEEELHAIIFMYKTDRHKYGNILDQMENQHGYSSDEDIAETPYADYNFTAIQEANEKDEKNE